MINNCNLHDIEIWKWNKSVESRRMMSLPATQAASQLLILLYMTRRRCREKLELRKQPWVKKHLDSLECHSVSAVVGSNVKAVVSVRHPLLRLKKYKVVNEHGSKPPHLWLHALTTQTSCFRKIMIKYIPSLAFYSKWITDVGAKWSSCRLNHRI